MVVLMYRNIKAFRSIVNTIHFNYGCLYFKTFFWGQLPFKRIRVLVKNDKRVMISIIYRIRTFNGRQIDINRRSAEAKLPRKTLTGELLRN